MGHPANLRIDYCDDRLICLNGDISGTDGVMHILDFIIQNLGPKWKM